MRHVLINSCYGGFGFSKEFIIHLCNKYGFPINEEFPEYSELGDMNEFQIAEEAIAYGLKEASGNYANLRACELPDGVEYIKSEYDGYEDIHFYVLVTLGELKNGLSDDKLALVDSIGRIEISRDVEISDEELASYETNSNLEQS